MPPRVDALRELIASGHLPVGTVLLHSSTRGPGAHRADREATATATVASDGINVAGTVYKSVSTAARAVTGYPTNGWTYWYVRSSGKP
jgi:hypothetical protein